MKSLQLRFLLAMLVGAVLFGAAAAALAYHMAFDRAIAHGRTTLEGLIVAVENTAAIGAYTTDKVLLQEVADGLARNPMSSSVQVRSAAGQVLVTHGALQAAAAGPRAQEVVVERTLHSPFDKNESVGRLTIKANMVELQRVARSEATTLTLLIAGQTGVVALLLYLLAARLVSAPIVRLAAKLRQVRPGSGIRLTLPALHRQDEIGILIEGANALLGANEVALQRERELRAEVEKMEEQYRTIFDTSSAGIFVLDHASRLIDCNPTVLRLIGAAGDGPQSLRGTDFLARAFARPQQVREMVAAAAQGGETAEADLELASPDGAARWVHALLSVRANGQAEPSAAAGLIEGVMYDITERKNAESAFRHSAEHDSLTGLKNRAAADAVIERFIVNAVAEGSAVSLLYIDLDGFKRVNDTLGHKAGDQVLLQCALRLRAAVRRSTDLIARVGGDEFLVALYCIAAGDEKLGQVGSAIIAGLREPILLEDGRQAAIGASVGIACFPRNAASRKGLLQCADEVMYEVKRTGKNGFAVFAFTASVPAPP